MADEEKEKEEDSPVPLVAHVIKFLHSVFSNVEVCINNQQVYDSNGLFAHKFQFSKIFKRIISEFHTSKGITMRYLPMRLAELPYPNLFSQRERNCSVDPIASFYTVNWGLI